MGITTIQTNAPRTVGFIGISTFLHFVAALSILLFANAYVKKPLPQITEVQILSAPPLPIPAPPQIIKPLAAPQEKVALTKLPSISKPLPAIAKSQLVARKLAPATVPAPTKTAPQVRRAINPSLKPSSSVAKAAAPPAPPVEAPNFDAAELGDIPVVVAPKLDESVIDEDLNNANLAANKDFALETDNLTKEAHQEISSLTNENEEQVSALELANKKESDRLAAIAEEAHKKNVKGIAQLVANDNARKAAAREAQAQAAASAKAAAQAAADARAAETAKSQVAGKGLGGSGEDIRGIEDLRQLPGNKRPEYDQDDRFNRRQGEVVFLAYVTRSGELTKFQLIKSSGHRTLDYKTLASLKNWKFYPGQEGVVEIPFLWDLKGGPQEIPSGLRTKIGQQGQRPTDLRTQ
jgi:TonB family protein